MNKSKILSVALAGALVASVAAVSTISASALSSDEVKSHKVGITGAFAECNSWNDDIEMTDNGDGTYSAEITNQEPGDYEFKVRLDGSWDYSWGDYEWEDAAGNPGDRTQNSQTNCKVTVANKTDVIKVTFDTTKISDKALAQDGSTAKELEGPDDEFAYNFWPVTYTVEAGAADEPATDEPATDTPATDTPATDTPATDTPATDAPATDTPAADAPATTETSDTKTVATGDTTSAIALVGVVLASLGTAVVMTKKASSKD
ncbi:MAG: hypothetical protein PUG48_02545 [Clostridia bacterium]|nr:hypothetical protein [Clostridia bacterium]